MQTCFIPKKLHIGFQKREGTFTGKLAYVIYEDEKGVIRKQKSWDSWRDKSIKTITLDNTPTPNFVFNKGIQRDNYHFGSGRHVFRIYDPRDFEFEVTVDNVIGILMHSDVCKRDIVEPCVYAWAGADLVLLPVNSKEYQESVKFTEKQSEKVSAKSLVKGLVYERKKHAGQWMYVGYYPYYELAPFETFTQAAKGKRHVFMNTESGNFEIFDVGSLSGAVTAEPDIDYANHLIRFENSVHSKLGVKVRGQMLDTLPKYEKFFNKWYKVMDDTSYIYFDLRAQDQYSKVFDGNISPNFFIHFAKLDGDASGQVIKTRCVFPDDYQTSMMPELITYLKQHNIGVKFYHPDSYWNWNRRERLNDSLEVTPMVRGLDCTLDYADFSTFLTNNGFVTSIEVLSNEGDILKTIS